jgi:PAS domain S-box-containing protein
MISYKKERPRSRYKPTRQRLAETQEQLDRLKIENQRLKEQLTAFANGSKGHGSLDATATAPNRAIAPATGSGATPPVDTPVDMQFGHREGMLGYFLDYSSTQAFISTTEGRYQYANDAFARFLGTTPDKVVGHSIYEFFPEEAAANYLKVNREAYASREIVKFIDPLKDENGRTSYGLTTVFPLPPRPGLEWVGGLMMDVTERVLLEKAFRQTEERLENLINQLPVYLIEVDTNGIFTMVDGRGFNGQAGRAHALLGQPVDKMFQDNPEVTEYYRRAVAGESIHTIVRTSPDLIYELRIAPLYDETGQVIKVHGTALDITRQTRMWEQLRQSEQRFIKVFNAAPLAIAIARTSDGTIVNVNKAFTELNGYSEEELIDRNIFELLQLGGGTRPGETTANYPLAEVVFSVRNWEVVTTNKRGEKLYLLVSTERVNFDGENCFIATCLDITEQKQIEAAKRETEERLEAILYNSPVFIFAKDKEGRYLMFNRYCEEYSKLAAKDVIGKTTYEAYGGDATKANELIGHDREVLRTGKPLVVEDEGLIDGQYYFDITTKFPMFDANGEVYAVGGISIDITERKIAEKALAAEKEQLAVTLSSIADGVITTNTLGQVMLVNRVAQEFTGWGQDEAQDKALAQIFKLLNPQTHQPASHPVGELLTTGRIAENGSPSFLLVARDGSERPIELSAAPIFDGQGQISGSVLVFRDISEKLKIIEEYQKVARLESLGLLAGGIAHDFNNLLTTIVGSISVARVYNGKPEMQAKLAQSLERAEKACLQSKELTQQLLTFARGGAPIKQKASLPELICDSANFVLQGSNIERQYELPLDTWLVEVDPSQLSQVVQNLVLNALQAMPGGGKLTIAAQNLKANDPGLKGLPLAEGSYVRFTVRDTGMGIAAEHQARIFDPYFTTKEAGNGLGLAICYSVIRNHQGHIQVQSAPNQGTVFNIFLPALEIPGPKALAENAPVTPALELEEQGLEPEPKKPPERVLVMEDDYEVRNLLADILDLLGYEVETSGDGAEALRLYAEAEGANRPFATVIMDMTIPGGMGGRETVRRLKEIYPQARAIVSSGYAHSDSLAEYQTLGFNGLICKPYRVKDIAAVLDEIIRG